MSVGSRFVRYGFPVLSTAVALLARFLMDPVLGIRIPYATFYIAVAASALLGGAMSGAIATALGAIATVYFFVPPRGSILMRGADNQLGFALYLIVSAIIVYSAHLQHRATRLLEQEVDLRKQRESAERLQRQRFEVTLEAVMEHIPEGLAIVDAEDVKVRMISRHGAGLFGRSREALEGTAATDLPALGIYHVDGRTQAAPEELPLTGAVLRGAITTGEEWVIKPRDGEATVILCDTAPIRAGDGRITGALMACRDISQRKKAEEALRESEERERAKAAELAAILDAAPVAMFISHDAECREIVGSRITYELLRLAPGSNLSRSAPEAERPTSFRAMREGREIPPRDLPMQRAASTGVPVRNCEFDFVYEDGTFRNMLGDAVPLFDESGSPSGAVGAFIDITERKRDEERLRQAQKLESVGLLAGGIAHDFNNLLTGIMGNASMVLDRVDPASAERIKEVISGSERAANLTRQLLAYSGKGQFFVRDVDISQAVSEMGDLMQFSIPKSADLAVNLQKRLPIVHIDPSQLQQIVMNLVINAGEAIGEGNPGKITVATSIADVETYFVDATGHDIAPGRYLSIEVTDTGAGIDEESKQKIFDPFYTTKFTGRGLGLAAVAGIARARKGAITVESAAGRGSTFRVFLPTAEGGEEQGRQQPEANVRGTVLIADDERSVREFIGAVLSERGYRVLTAADGRDALTILDQEQCEIDGIVLDIVMPAMGAGALLPELKARRPKLGVLLTSGYNETEARRLCAAYPNAAFIQKPYTAQQILKAVEDVLGAGKSPRSAT